MIYTTQLVMHISADVMKDSKQLQLLKLDYKLFVLIYVLHVNKLSARTCNSRATTALTTEWFGVV